MKLRKPYRKPRLPEGRFILVWDPAQPNDEIPMDAGWDGPFDSQEVAYDPDGATVLLSEGAPYRMLIAKQNGSVLTMHDGTQLRLEPFPLPSWPSAQS